MDDGTTAPRTGPGRPPVPRPAGRLHPLAIIAAAISLAVLLKLFALDLVLVSGDSMRPTAEPGTLAVVLPSAYGLRDPFRPGYLVRWAEPEPGDLVIVRAVDPGAGRPASGNRNTAFKRVLELGPAFLRLEGRRLEGRGGAVELDAAGAAGAARRLYVPAGTAFVVGDNAEASFDSRDYGPVPIENIRAKVLVLLGP